MIGIYLMGFVILVSGVGALGTAIAYAVRRDRAVGFVGDARTFEGVWKTLKPGEAVPEIDFKANLVLFVRNTQFYNRIRIGKVMVTNGVAEVLAMETMSAMLIED